MIIDARSLNEVYVKKVRLVANDERFYEVKGNENYALSTYGRLYEHKDGHWKKVPVIYKRGECYQMRDQTIPVCALMARVFFPNREGLYLYPYEFSPLDPKRWDLKRLFVLETKEDLVEVLQSKLEHREPQIDESKKRNSFIGRMEFGVPVNKALERKYSNMRSRATNQKIKARDQNYKNTEISEEWLENPELFYRYIFQHQYYYPGKLSIDKDLLGYGLTDKYAPEYVTLLPFNLNNVFTSNTSRLGYCIQKKVRTDGSVRFVVPQSAFAIRGEKQDDLSFDRYTDALVAGRRRKADYIRKIADLEKKAGYLPEYILDAMNKWADRCELGLVKIWEPSESALEELGLA